MRFSNVLLHCPFAKEGGLLLGLLIAVSTSGCTDLISRVPTVHTSSGDFPSMLRRNVGSCLRYNDIIRPTMKPLLPLFIYALLLSL
jgi:hypothetical protein